MSQFSQVAVDILICHFYQILQADKLASSVFLATNVPCWRNGDQGATLNNRSEPETWTKLPVECEALRELADLSWKQNHVTPASARLMILIRDDAVL